MNKYSLYPGVLTDAQYNEHIENIVDTQRYFLEYEYMNKLCIFPHDNSKARTVKLLFYLRNKMLKYERFMTHPSNLFFFHRSEYNEENRLHKERAIRITFLEELLELHKQGILKKFIEKEELYIEITTSISYKFNTHE